jgi:hypothetical protein
MDLKTFKTDLKLEIEGVWFPIDEKARLKVARYGNDRFKELMSKKARPYKQSIRNDTLPDRIYDKILIEAMAETILLDWENIEENDTPIPYSVENAKRLLTEYKDFRDLVSNFSNEAASYRAEERQDDLKN